MSSNIITEKRVGSKIINKISFVYCFILRIKTLEFQQKFKMTKIAIITPWEEKCGIAIYSAKLVDELTKMGVEVSILKTKIKCNNPLFFKELAERASIFDLVNVQFQLGLYGPKGLFASIFFNSLSSAKIVITMHETIAINPETTFGKIISPYKKFLISNVVRNSDAIIAHNKYVQKTVECLTNKKVNHIPFPLEIAEIQKCISLEKVKQKLGIKQKNVLLTFGFVVPNKGFERVIKALKYIPDTFLLIAGEERNAKYSEKLKKLAIMHNVQDRVKFIGFVKKEELPLIFGLATLVIFPYLYSETSAAIIQALGFEKCIISSDIQTFDEFKCIEKFKNESNLISMINYYIKHPEKIKEQEEKQQKFAIQIKWPIVAKKIKEIYEECFKIK